MWCGWAGGWAGDWAEGRCRSKARDEEQQMCAEAVVAKRGGPRTGCPIQLAAMRAAEENCRQRLGETRKAGTRDIAIKEGVLAVAKLTSWHHRWSSPEIRNLTPRGGAPMLPPPTQVGAVFMLIGYRMHTGFSSVCRDPARDPPTVIGSEITIAIKPLALQELSPSGLALNRYLALHGTRDLALSTDMRLS